MTLPSKRLEACEDCGFNNCICLDLYDEYLNEQEEWHDTK